MFVIFDGDFGEKLFSNLILEGECKGNYGIYLEDFG